MKKRILLLVSCISVVLCLGCQKSMNYVIENEPNFVGKVASFDDDSMIVDVNEDDPMYSKHQRIDVSLEVEYKDSMTHFDIGDEVVVYYNRIELDNEFDELPEVEDTLAITLRTPANRASN